MAANTGRHATSFGATKSMVPLATDACRSNLIHRAPYLLTSQTFGSLAWSVKTRS